MQNDDEKQTESGAERCGEAACGVAFDFEAKRLRNFARGQRERIVNTQIRLNAADKQDNEIRSSFTI